MIVCAHLPRFALSVAAGGPEALAGRALAIAPCGVGAQRVGEVSPTAQASGVAAGMGLGEALARCPALVLVPGDPVGVAQAWEQAMCALEGIGAEIETPRPGLAYFDAQRLRALHAGGEGTTLAARRALGRPARIGGGPTRFCALAAALEARLRRPRLVEERSARRYLAARPVELLSHREQTAALVPSLGRLGILTLGDLVKLGADAVADRFGKPGSLARSLALGEDTPLRARRVGMRLQESMELGESSSGEALERTLSVLVDRLLARPERRGRTIRALALSARLVERGTWSSEVVFASATSDPVRMRLALAVRLASLPAPAETVGLSVLALGPASGGQTTLLEEEERTARLMRLRDAVAQVRTGAGPDAALRALPVDPGSRVPERRYVFTPFTP
jgi:nucleotidyltransferase/DNA polymerase involved in DNA repair